MSAAVILVSSNQLARLFKILPDKTGRRTFSQKIIDYLKKITIIRSMFISFRHNIFVALLLITPSICFAQAYARFSVTNMPAEFSTIQATGAASQHVLNINVRTNGAITGTGKRYDIEANAVSIANTNGVRVTVLTNSRLGTPVVTTTNIDKRTEEIYVVSPTTGIMITNKVVLTNWNYETTCPFGVFLSDGTKAKGVANNTRYVSQQWDYTENKITRSTNDYQWYEAGATYESGFGNSSWSLPRYNR